MNKIQKSHVNFENVKMLIVAVMLLTTNIVVGDIASEPIVAGNCELKEGCIKRANSFLLKVNKMTGLEVKGKRYLTENEANLAAAKMYQWASVVSKKEVHWITFEEENQSKAFGYTYPAVSKYNKHISNNAARVYDEFKAHNKVYKARSLGHSHFGLNECFSYHDLMNMYRKKGNFFLVTKSGNVSYINQSILKNDYGIHQIEGVREYLHRQRVNKKIKFGWRNVFDTGVYGTYVGNINDNIKEKIEWKDCNNIGR